MALVLVSITLNERGVYTPRNVFHDAERTLITRTLEICDGNISAAADRLGVFRSSLQRKMAKLGIGGAS